MSRVLDIIYSLPCRLGFHDYRSVTFRYGSWVECMRCGRRR